MKKLITINVILAVMLCTIPKPKPQEIAKANNEQVLIKDAQSITNRSEQNRSNLKTSKEITKISQEGIDFIKKFEGCKLTAYKLKNECYYTIGYGHNSGEIYKGQQITQVEAETLLKNDLERFEQYVYKKCKHLNLNQNEFDALVSFTFNCGTGNLNKLIKNRNKQQIAEKMTSYTKSASESNRAGLLKRRTAEKNKFLGGKINEK